MVKHGIYKVTKFKIVGPRSLQVTFDDRSSQTIDFSPALQGRLYGALKKEDLFRQVAIDPEVHTLVWPNGADFDPETLHDWPRTSWGSQASTSSRTLSPVALIEVRAESPPKAGPGTEELRNTRKLAKRRGRWRR